MAGDLTSLLTLGQLDGDDIINNSPHNWFNDKENKTVANPRLPEGIQNLTDSTTNKWAAMQQALWDQMMPGVETPDLSTGIDGPDTGINRMTDPVAGGGKTDPNYKIVNHN